jgi:hypothetical protein
MKRVLAVNEVLHFKILIQFKALLFESVTHAWKINFNFKIFQTFLDAIRANKTDDHLGLPMIFAHLSGCCVSLEMDVEVLYFVRYGS